MRLSYVHARFASTFPSSPFTAKILSSRSPFPSQDREHGKSLRVPNQHQVTSSTRNGNV